MEAHGMNNQPINYEAYEKYPGIFISQEWSNNYLEIKTDNHCRLRVYVLEDHVFRFRYATMGMFEDDFSYAIDEKYHSTNPKPQIEENFDELIITTRLLKCHISKRHLSCKIKNLKGQIVLEDEKGFHWEEFEKYGGDIVKMSKKVGPGEAYFGLGDKPVEPNLRGHRFMNWGMDQYGYTKETDPLYKNINFFYGHREEMAYGIFLDNSFKSFFDFASERRNVTSYWSDGGEMNYYFIYGPEMMQVATSYVKLTGTPEMPPLWALGYQQCKWSYYPESQVKSVTATLRKLQIPCDAIYLDIDYMDGFRCFTWDKEKFPNPKKMIQELADDGFKTMVIIDPGIKIDHNYSVFNEALEKGYFCRRADGPFVKGKVWPGECFFPDFTNPEVRAWWADLFEELIAETGVAGVWNDMNEPALFEVENKSFPNDVRHDYDGHPCSHRKGHNIYGMQMTRATFEGVKKHLGGKRPLIITRSGYNGLQRYSSVWTGDNLANWEHLQIAHFQTQRLSISGISFCGSDIGGFIGQPNGELYVRWIQQAIFHPFMRTHSSGDHGDQEPWSFGEKYLDHAREFINLRYQILPYLYTVFYQYHKWGKPMLRPLSFMHPDRSVAYKNKFDECYLGDSLLFVPIMQPGAMGRLVYLPEGEWYDYFNDEKYSGDQEHYIHADLNKIPLFIKGGSIMPHFPIMQYTGEKAVEEMELKVYVGSQEVESEIYLDGFEGYAYQSGSYRYATFLLQPKENGIRIHQKIEGDYSGPLARYRFSFGKRNTVIGAKMNQVNSAVILKDDNSLVVDANFETLNIDFKQ